MTVFAKQAGVLLVMTLAALSSGCSTSTTARHDNTSKEKDGAGSNVTFFQLFGKSYGIDNFERWSDGSRTLSRQGLMPTGRLIFSEAKKVCARAGGRICTLPEWRWACRTVSARETRCEKSQELLPSGMHCPGNGPGPRDMESNLLEWAVYPRTGAPVIAGVHSDCLRFRQTSRKKRAQNLGVRCCY